MDTAGVKNDYDGRYEMTSPEYLAKNSSKWIMNDPLTGVTA